MARILTDVRGTFENTFQVGKSGVKLTNDSGILKVQDKDGVPTGIDASYLEIPIAPPLGDATAGRIRLYSDGVDLFLNLDLPKR
jgi:hypothetical protein